MPDGTSLEHNTEDHQSTAMRMMAAEMEQCGHPSFMMGDINVWLGDKQEPLTHDHVRGWGARRSDHKIAGALSRAAKLFMDVVTSESLVILNGRFGPSSEIHTYERGGTRTTIDYAVCRQEWGPTVKQLQVQANISDLSDHRALHLHVQCDTRAVDLDEDEIEDGEEWWEEEARVLINVSPFKLPKTDPDRQILEEKYQAHLVESLRAPQAHLRTLLNQWKICQERRHSQRERLQPCPPSCPCHNIQQNINQIYSEITTGILGSAEEVLDHTSPTTTKQQQRRLVWRPGKKWNELKQQQISAWKHLNRVDPASADYHLIKERHKSACRTLRIHTIDDRAKWQSKRFSKISLHGPSHVAKHAWSRLKRSLGVEIHTGLPKRVKTDDGKILRGEEASKEWHKTRARIGNHDEDHPGFDALAHGERKKKLKMIEASEAEVLRTAPPPSIGDDKMMSAFRAAEVDEVLRDCNKGTSPGTDGLAYELLTNGGECVRDTLLLLYNLVWATGIHPEEWDQALIRALYKPKTKDPLVIAHYRAVTLINSLCKGYESLLFNRTSEHLEARHGIAPGQGARRHMGTEELLYTMSATARDRHAHTGEGTYVCFLDYTLAYPSTDHNVIFTKMKDKGIEGRLWSNIRHLYRNMRSRVMHPGIAHDDFFGVTSGVREGSVLSPILFIIAVDDMFQYLRDRPFRQPDLRPGLWSRKGKRPKAGADARQHRRGQPQPPGVWICTVYLALLQFVDDSALLATSPEELQHMIDVIAEYCALYRLSLNPKPGKTEVVEFMCEPSGFQYTVSTPTMADSGARTKLRVSEGYRYLGWWLDKWLTFKRLVAETMSSVDTETEKIAAMGGQPGGLPIRTTFHLWTSLALAHVRSNIALLSNRQVDMIQHTLTVSIQKLAGTNADPQSVMADLGLPDARTVRDLRFGTLIHRLRTLPEYMVAAQLHRHLMSTSVTQQRGYEAAYCALLTKYNSLDQWLLTPAPHHSLTKVESASGDMIDPIRRARSTQKRAWKNKVWELRRASMLRHSAPFDSAKFKLFASIARTDLLRKPLWAGADYLMQHGIGPKHKLALFQLRTQSSLLEAHQPGAAEEEEHIDSRCDGCDARLTFLQEHLKELLRHPNTHDHSTIQRCQTEVQNMTDLLSNDPPEDWEHALFHCTKGDLPALRQQWQTDMGAIFQRYEPRPQTQADQQNGQQQPPVQPQPLSWADLEPEQQTQVALGTALPPTWKFPGRKAKFREEKRLAFRQATMGLCATFALQICRVLRNYRKAVVADDQAKNKDWDEVNRSFDWGPMMEESSDSDIEPADDNAPDDNPDADDVE